MVSRSEGGERLQVVDERFAGRDVVPANVAHHPVHVLGILLGQVAVRVGQDQSPERV